MFFKILCNIHKLELKLKSVNVLVLIYFYCSHSFFDSFVVTFPDEALDYWSEHPYELEEEEDWE